MVKLFCAIVGVAGNPFSVLVDEGDSVDELKKAIKEAKVYGFPADELELFLAKKVKGRGAWVTEEEAKSGVGNTTDLKPLKSVRAKLRVVGLSDEDVGGVDENEEAEERGPVNVLVVVPTDKRAASDHFPALFPEKKRRVDLRVAYAGPLHVDEFSVPMETIAAFNDIQAGFSMEGSCGPLYMLYGPRQFGKSTIAHRIVNWIAADPQMSDVECIFIELRTSNVRDAATFWTSLGMRIEPDSVCPDENAFIKLATRGQRRFCLIVDEMDHLFDNKDLAKTFLSVLRTWKAASYFCGFLGVGSHDLVHHYKVFRGDMKSSPFNVGNMIKSRFDAQLQIIQVVLLASLGR
ncbi:hypothetical protein PR003_g32488 [Phytophthora rubi]|uniref:Uncharacterized protein n=1 Tax=Phytophthora rubi TaxID=129364 RepID=A0A6A4B163_9STRA|nr:hypothetical protein PR003_g32488 [Phytophthora rubi]